MKKTDFDFKTAFAELEKLSEWFQREDIDLNEGLAKYKRGMELVKEIEKHLKGTENEFKKVKKG
ncbi:MAG: exodeoxyribonuclease VII small subunit [Candidatus Yanofskybacteria bacterium RIFCSPLOWO2_01_FULL_49_25]|uniref:Exodeoxyribonuclease VII small subunit n=1 Tax=Candidatus Yanofskybacteria bacterium RIFCSPLOWO2_01_FULL_49_25 TaxID=1802701 RepID=A0A1F8GVF8_9BACT|nr:MAG: exodeoxyribonuclease VII small subunit [Candidatus Yanofskybacteria bacterium RIFCSPLOWO2_01_FULL_49_25]